jgi:hypothetical protein
MNSNCSYHSFVLNQLEIRIVEMDGALNKHATDFSASTTTVADPAPAPAPACPSTPSALAAATPSPFAPLFTPDLTNQPRTTGEGTTDLAHFRLDDDEDRDSGRPPDEDLFLSDFDASGGSNNGGPSSVEAQADPNDLELSNQSLDLDLEIPETSFPLSDTGKGTSASSAAGYSKSGGDTDMIDLGGGGDNHNDGQQHGPFYGPQNDPLAEATAANESGVGQDLCFFDFLTPNVACAAGDEEEDLKSEHAQGGVVGLRNVGNTCYMNSGIQCLMATPSVVRFFLRDYKFMSRKTIVELEECGVVDGKKADDKMSKAMDLSTQLLAKFCPLVEDMWKGGYRKMKPSSFKEALGEMHPQFRGAMQHDCQEFLALLLDSLHEELKGNSAMSAISGGGSMAVLGALKASTSMELNASSTDYGVAKMDEDDDGVVPEMIHDKAAAAEDRGSRESESASPKSFDSQSSLGE